MDCQLRFGKLLEVANIFANDLLGKKKEFANRENDNLIVFMVRQKKISLDLAVQICDFLESEPDYILLEKAILKEFNNDDNLI